MREMSERMKDPIYDFQFEMRTSPAHVGALLHSWASTRDLVRYFSELINTY
jgi:hypothetical protein